MKYAIEIENASLYVGEGALALKNFSWKVPERDHAFILGPNGAGKTSLVKMLLGHKWPLFGASIKVLGETFGKTNLTELRKRVSWISPFMQQFQPTHLNVLDTVLSGLDATLGFFRDPTEAEKKRAIEIMEKLGCAHLVDREITAVSSGEQVKILICRSLMRNPELVILDEACVHLDLKSREFLLKTIDDFARQDDAPTIIFITQRIEDILPVFTHGLMLRSGEIVVDGPRDSVLTAENLSNTFDMKLSIRTNDDGRIWPVLE